MSKQLLDRIASLKAKKDALDARLVTLEAKAKNEDRKRETRQKIIVGGAVIAQMQKSPQFAAVIRALLAASVGRSADKEAIAELLAPADTTPPHAPIVAPPPAPSSPQPETIPAPAHASAAPDDSIENDFSRLLGRRE